MSQRMSKLVVLVAVVALVALVAPSLVWASWGQRMILPTSGTVSQEFSGSHAGMDIAAPSGTPVYAVSNGVVMNAQKDLVYGAGNYVVIRHAPGDYNAYRRYCPSDEWTKYCHLNTVCVRPGQVVWQGQLIGTVGKTGNATGNHLHFEIRIGARLGTASNPREWIRSGYSRLTGKGDIW
jgi:murein DD-endopeptidase MepM/ murein hydrolase activator NlpD